ncbi:thiF family domain-containing protein [Ditylenchus destructor]|nr:thiF family domain-containing protein [Ditylenchus destructor]
MEQASVRYDRQVRLWGEEGQQSIQQASVCVLGSSALATEILKSLVLAGVGKFRVIDDAVIGESDLKNVLMDNRYLFTGPITFNGFTSEYNRLAVPRTKMIELFTTFGKGGLVLWCFNEGSQYFKEAVNELISTVLLKECNVTSFNREGATIKYKLDNEFEIIVLLNDNKK